MGPDKTLPVFIGWDEREAVASDVCAHSLRKRTKSHLNITLLKHRQLRQAGHFLRPWLIESDTGDVIDLIDNKKSSTQFSHTRFLVPALMQHKGWALFMDSDMVVLSDIQRLFDLCDDKYAVMCVKHNHIPPLNAIKMDGREQLRYHRKNWSSFTLWNCAHPANSMLTEDRVNTMKGSALHSFSWLDDSLIGELPYTYNYISGISQKIPHGIMPQVIHYTDGGPWFPECQDVPYAGIWIEEYEDWQRNGTGIKFTEIPSTAYER